MFRLPGAGGGIIEFGAGEDTAGCPTSRDEDFPVRQQSRGMEPTFGLEAAGGAPGAGGRFINLRTGQTVKIVIIVVAARDQNLAVRQKRGRMVIACRGQTARSAPNPGRGIVKLCAPQITRARPAPAGDKDLAVRQERSCVPSSGGGQAAGILEGEWSACQCPQGCEAGSEKEQREHDSWPQAARSNLEWMFHRVS